MIKNLSGPFPLTIFNPKWQEAANSFHIGKRVKSDDKNLLYKGYPMKSDWDQTFGEWTNNYRVFINTLVDVYKFKLFGEWVQIHKKNVDGIQDQPGFMTAFRYNIKVKNNVFGARADIGGGEVVVPDISIKRDDFLEDAWVEVQMFGEIGMTDNPYAIGNARHGWDPITGKNLYGRTNNFQQKQQDYKNDYSKGEYQSNYIRFGAGQGPSGSGIKKRGYQGKKFNPSYVEKRHGTIANGDNNFSKQYVLEPLKTAIDNDNSLNTCLRWPLKVKCEMNVELWREGLTKAGLLKKFGDVLDGFVNGFDQGVPEHTIPGLKWFTPLNYSSANLAREKVEKTICRELKLGRMFGPFTREEVFEKVGFFRTSPMGAVVNGDGSTRPINDLSFPKGNPHIPWVNSFVNKLDFKTTWDDFATVSRFFWQLDGNVVLGLFDWEKAYRQVPTNPAQWKYLMVLDFNDSILLDTRITFGGVAGCGSFGRPADAWKCLMQAEFDLHASFQAKSSSAKVKSAKRLL